MFEKINSIIFTIIIISYSLLTIFLINDYGITLDEPVNFGMGHKYLYFYQTGHLDLQDDLPKIKDHPKNYDINAKNIPHMIFSLENILSALTCYIFYQKLNLLNPIPAHHIIIPILMLFFLFIFYFFVKKYWNQTTALISVISLITFPRFFGHTFNNIKDIPEIIFFATTIFFFAQWILEIKLKYLYLSFVFWGFALATKMDALLIPAIILLWQTPSLYKKIKKNSSIKIRILLNFGIGFIISGIIFLLCFPPLLPWAYKNLKDYLDTAPNFIFSMFRYSAGIGSDITTGWNLYAPKQIFYTTPILMLILFIIGCLYILIKKLKNKPLNQLLIIWLLFIIGRHCCPKVGHYDGLRHFLIFIIPFSIIIGIGTNFLIKKISLKLKFKKSIISFIFFLIILLPNIYILKSIHPYQTTYYNCIVGGLKGAQEKDIPFSSDYWLNSIKGAINWLNKNAKQNSKITSPLLNYYDPNIFFYYQLRKDLQITNFDSKNLPHIDYIIYIPRKWIRLDWGKHQKIEKLIPIKNYKIIYQKYSQDGKIIEIYSKI